MESKITVTREHEISAGHRVVGQGGSCEHLHGHNYVISFTCYAELNSVGMVIDFGIIKTKLCKWLEDNYDHRFLMWENDPWLKIFEMKFFGQQDQKATYDNFGIKVVPFNPTAEEIGKYLLEVVGPEVLADSEVTLTKVVVQETAKCRAEVSLS